MDYIDEFVDDRQKGWCIHCGGGIGQLGSNRDHVPSKSLLHKPYPDNLPVVEICQTCNSGFSSDEEYMAAFLGAVLTGSTEPEAQASPVAGRILRRNLKLRSQIERAKTEYSTVGGDTRVIWKPDMARVTNVVVKNARGHAFYEYGEPMLSEPDHVGVWPLESLTGEEHSQFETIDMGMGWPEVGSRMLTRVITGQDLEDGWVIVQDGIYRYAVMQHGLILVRIVISEYLAAEVHWSV